MNLVHTLAIGLSLACLLNCLGADSPKVLPIRSLAKGGMSGIRDPKRELIKETGTWEKLWKQHAVSAGASGKTPAVDFSKEMVIASTMGTKRTGGYSIEILRVEAAGKVLKIYINQSSPPPGAMSIQVLTAPFHFVAVPRSDLKPEFVETNAGKDK
jgi:hypothetical protein